MVSVGVVFKISSTNRRCLDAVNRIKIMKTLVRGLTGVHILFFPAL